MYESTRDQRFAPALGTATIRVMDKIVGVGKNYAEHARELGDAVPERPVLFLKPPSVLRTSAGWEKETALVCPRDRGELHFECEIVLRLADRATIDAVTLGLDMTLRSEQLALKKAGHPWTTAKVFPDAALIGPFIAIGDFADYLDTEFTFALDGKVRQRARGLQMLTQPKELLAYIGSRFPLCPGDVVFTGTPCGVGPVTAGSRGELAWGDRRFSVAFI